VLADGVLARASLSDAEATFVFNWGVFLQLADDLQDVAKIAATASSRCFRISPGASR